jgi:hypothetical protein
LTFTNPLTLETIQVEAPSQSFEKGLKAWKKGSIISVVGKTTVGIVESILL